MDVRQSGAGPVDLLDHSPRRISGARTSCRSGYCDGDTFAWGSSDAALTCSMNGGASGGPWLKDRIDANLGYVFAVTSRRTTSGTPTLLSTPNTPDVKTMFDAMTT